MTQILFQLDCFTRKDDDAKVFVGYIPALNVFTQASTEDRLEQALNSAATLYLGTCHKRGLLDKVLKRVGWSQSPGVNIEEAQQQKGQWVAVLDEAEMAEELPQYDKRVKVEINLAALAAAA